MGRSQFSRKDDTAMRPLQKELGMRQRVTKAGAGGALFSFQSHGVGLPYGRPCFGRMSISARGDQSRVRGRPTAARSLKEQAGVQS